MSVDPPDGPRRKRLKARLLDLPPSAGYKEVEGIFSGLASNEVPLVYSDAPGPVLEDRSDLRSLRLGYAKARKASGQDLVAQARKNADAQAARHMIEAMATIPAQFVSGQNLTQNLGRTRDAAVQGALSAGNVAAEVQGRNREIDAQTAFGVEQDRLSELRTNNERKRVAEMERLQQNRELLAQLSQVQQANREAERYNQEQARGEFFQNEGLRLQRAQNARANANASLRREAAEREAALQRLDVLAKAGMLDRATDEDFAATGYDRDVLEAMYRPDTSLPPALASARAFLEPLRGQRDTWIPFDETRGYGAAKSFLGRVSPQAEALADELRKELVKLPTTQREAYAPMYRAALETLGLAAGGEEQADDAIRAFNDSFIGAERALGGGPQRGEAPPPSLEELYAMADAVPEQTGGASSERRGAVTGSASRSVEERARAFLESNAIPTEEDALPAEVEIPRDAVVIPIADLAGNDLYPPALQEVIRRNGGLDGMKVVVVDDEGAVVPFGADTYVLDNYAAISSGLARARDYARRERLERLNAEQAERMRSQSSGSETARSAGVYGSGRTR